MSQREERLSTLAGLATLGVFVVYGVYFLVPPTVVIYLRILWVTLLAAAIVFEAASRWFGRRGRRLDST